MGGLADWMLLGGVVAVALAAAAATRDPQPLERPRRVLAWFGRAPDSTWARVARALLVGIAGIVAFLEPTLALQIAAVLAGAVAIYYAVVELIAAIAPAAKAPAKGQGRAQAASTRRELADAGAARRRRSSRRRSVVAFVITDEDKREAKRPVGPVKNCNGYAQLCDRTLDDVAFPAAHNAMSAAELPGWFAPNQRRGIQRQLEGGRPGLPDRHPLRDQALERARC